MNPRRVGKLWWWWDRRPRHSLRITSDPRSKQITELLNRKDAESIRKLLKIPEAFKVFWDIKEPLCFQGDKWTVSIRADGTAYQHGFIPTAYEYYESPWSGL